MQDNVFKKMEAKLNSVVQLPAEEINYLFSKMAVIQISKGQHLLKEGASGSIIYFVNKGVLRTYLTTEEKEINTEFFFEDSFAGAFTSFLLQQPTALNMEVLEDAELLSLSKQLLDELYTRNPLWLAIGKHIFETEFIKKCKRESSFLKLSAQERYLSLLHQYPQIEERVALRHIASYLGIQPESLSRIRASKISKGLTYIK